MDGMDDLIKRLQARKVFNGNTTVKRDHEGAPWHEEKQYVTDALCAEAAAALTEAQATIARMEALVGELQAGIQEALDWNWLDDDAPEYVRERLWLLSQRPSLSPQIKDASND